MATEKQRDANRSNAQLSTGPRTDPGKQRSAVNALKHGLTARVILLPGEDPEVWRQHCDDVISDLRPTTALQIKLAETIAMLLWQLLRIENMEAGVLAWAVRGAAGSEGENGHLITLGKAYAASQHALANLSRHETLKRRALFNTLHELERLQAREAGEWVETPIMVDVHVASADQ